MATAQVSHFGSRSVGCGFKHAPQHFDAVPSMFRGMTRVTWSCLYFWAVSVSGDITTECCESSGEDLPSFLQVTVEVNRSWRYDTNSTSFQTTKILNTNTSRSGPKFWQAQAKTVETGHEATLEKEKVTPVLHLVSEFSKGVYSPTLCWFVDDGAPLDALWSSKKGSTTWKCSGWMWHQLGDLSLHHFRFNLEHHGSVCTESSTDGCWPLRISSCHECHGAKQLRGEIRFWTFHC